MFGFMCGIFLNLYINTFGKKLNVLEMKYNQLKFGNTIFKKRNIICNNIILYTVTVSISINFIF
jgi:hypothetical protein